MYLLYVCLNVLQVTMHIMITAVWENVPLNTRCQQIRSTVGDHVATVPKVFKHDPPTLPLSAVGYHGISVQSD